MKALKPERLKDRTFIMGVLNVTPDSFSDGGAFLDKAKAIERAHEMADEGADIIDVGGESTRPGALDVPAAEEISRVIPVIEGISKKLDIPVSVDTRKAEVAREALKAGASIINDVSGLHHDKELAVVAAKAGAVIILMHMKGEPRDMQQNPVYKNLMQEVRSGLEDSIGIAKKAGVKEEDIIIDPGIGFGKTIEHNLEILRRLAELKARGRPICVGISRKSFIGKILGLANPADRLIGTIAASVIAVENGANLLRVHDVKEAVQAVRMADSILSGKAN